MIEWRAIKGFEGKYAVSNEGDVMSMNFANTNLPGILKPKVDRGYHRIDLKKGGGKSNLVAIHKLVIESFIGDRPCGMQINHIDGCKSNNRLENLEYCTQSENMKHAFRTGLQSNKGEKHSRSILLDSDVVKIRTLLRAKVPQQVIADHYKISSTTISKINRGKAWAHVPREEIET